MQAQFGCAAGPHAPHVLGSFQNLLASSPMMWARSRDCPMNLLYLCFPFAALAVDASDPAGLTIEWLVSAGHGTVAGLHNVAGLCPGCLPIYR